MKDRLLKMRHGLKLVKIDADLEPKNASSFNLDLDFVDGGKSEQVVKKYTSIKDYNDVIAAIGGTFILISATILIAFQVVKMRRAGRNAFEIIEAISNSISQVGDLLNMLRRRRRGGGEAIPL